MCFSQEKVQWLRSRGTGTAHQYIYLCKEYARSATADTDRLSNVPALIIVSEKRCLVKHNFLQRIVLSA